MNSLRPGLPEAVAASAVTILVWTGRTSWIEALVMFAGSYVLARSIGGSLGMADRLAEQGGFRRVGRRLSMAVMIVSAGLSGGALLGISGMVSAWGFTVWLVVVSMRTFAPKAGVGPARAA